MQPIDAFDAPQRQQETLLGDLVADAIRFGTPSDIGVINGGAMRLRLRPAGRAPRTLALGPQERLVALLGGASQEQRDEVFEMFELPGHSISPLPAAGSSGNNCERHSSC
jgi:hypothetical protein